MKPRQLSFPVALIVLILGFLHSTEVFLSVGRTESVMTSSEDFLQFLPVMLAPSPTTVHIVANHSYYQSVSGMDHVVGEVYNNTDTTVFWIRVSVNFYDNSRQLVDTESTLAILDYLPSGERTCFNVRQQESVPWESYEFELPAYSANGNLAAELTLLNVSAAYNASSERYRILGQIRNDDDSRAEFVGPVATLYNSARTVIGCGFAFVNSVNLDPGQVSSFELFFDGAHFADVADYRLQTDGIKR